MKCLTTLTCIVDKSYNYTEKTPASTTINLPLLSAYSVECSMLLFMFFSFKSYNNAMWHGLLFLIKSLEDIYCSKYRTEKWDNREII